MRLRLDYSNQEDRVSQYPEHIRKLCHDIHAFTATADRSVVSLYAISRICWSNFGSGDIQRDLAGKLKAVVGALSSLRGIIDATPKRSLLSASDVEILTQCLHKCEPIVQRIEAAVQKLDDYLAAQPEKNTRIQPPGLYNAFNPGGEKEPASILSECFIAIMHAIVTAKAELLSGNDHLTSSESSEAFRLKQALPNSDLQAPVKRSIPFTCSQSVRQATNTPSTQSSTLFCTQPPAAQQPSQHQPAQPQPTFSNLWDIKPWLNPTENYSKPPPSITASDKMAFGKPDNDGSNATPLLSKWVSLAGQNQQHLEAYIVRTTVKSHQEFSITWSYAIDLLPLDNDTMVTHTKNLGPGYSIINAIGELSREQLRLVQERTKARDGQLVAVQFGAATDVATSMGTFKVKPVIFVVKTAAAPAGSKSIFDKASVQYTPVPAAGSLFGTPWKAPSGGLFGSITKFPLPPTSTPPSTAPCTSGACFHEEKTGFYGADHFMSISCADTHRNKSFEEIRLDDINAGRVPATAPLSAEAVSDETPNSPPTPSFSAPKLFVKSPADLQNFWGGETFKTQPGASDATTASPQVEASSSATAESQNGLFGATTGSKDSSFGALCTPKFELLPGTFGAPDNKQTLSEKNPNPVQALESASPQNPAVMSERAFGCSTAAIPANTFGFGGYTNPVPAPVKAPSELTGTPSKAAAEENETPDATCRKCTAPVVDSLGLCLSCTGKETACWLCHDDSEPVASKGAVATKHIVATKDTLTSKDKITSKDTASPKLALAPTTGKRQRAPSLRNSLLQTAAERKQMAKAEDFDPEEESDEMWSTRYDLLQKCQVE